jgi:hypothetical protein
LKDRYEQCSKGRSGLVPFEKKKLADQLVEAFPQSEGSCERSDLLTNQLNWLFRYVCLRQTNLPSFGFFYPKTNPEASYRQLIASASLEEKKFLWPEPTASSMFGNAKGLTPAG